MLEQKINEMFGDDEPTGFGTGWWSGVLSAFFGMLAFGAVVCLHFPQLLSSPELRPHYPMPLMRMLIQAVIVAAIILGVVSAFLRRKKSPGSDRDAVRACARLCWAAPAFQSTRRCTMARPSAWIGSCSTCC